MKRIIKIVLLLSATVSFSPLFAQLGSIDAANFPSVTDEMLINPPAEDWLMWRRTQNGWGFSPLDQIDKSNVADLRMVWTRALTDGSQTGTPLAYNGVLYMPNPNDVIQAINAATGDLIWEHRREIPEGARDSLGFLSSNNRNIAIWQNLIIDTSVDDHLFALNAATGEQVWESLVLDFRTHPAIQGAGPIVGNGKVFSGRSCRPIAGPDACVITAHDAATGAELWRRRTIPAPGEPGDETWGDVPFEERRHVGAWMPPSYDPELNTVFIGTSVTSPAPKFLLGGVDNQHLYHNSTLALDGNTGEINWYYQHLNDNWDLDHPFERLLVDTAVAPDPNSVSWINPNLNPGEERKVMTGIPGKTGLVYTLDRETGEFLWARETVYQNVIDSIDGASGGVTINPSLTFREMGEFATVCPNMHGGKDWEAGAYSPETNTMYYPLRNMCMPTLVTDDESASHRIYAMSVRHEITEGETNLGTVYAISAETGRTAWKYEQRAATGSLIATGGGLLFGGDTNGRFKAYDQTTGEVLWEVNLGSPVTGYPITFSTGGKQYVAVSTGSAATTASFLSITPEYRPTFANNLYVFALP
ncbi:MAG: PQQ-binding-like beta-propeller repeat protein [Gammaproteobacteria bacterium]|nr:PQQ-binding-like beta-propeller repeat protein [Gammaproteobacteria bacterium]MDD9894738.1 PQQ-binding-like beta-propeller repeat protein [Gammaproteobacteria bacterium]MDD9957868.1 PQQ-binding-like beta-propeller repeat protein [Gammaproteobacteria bacterium]